MLSCVAKTFFICAFVIFNVKAESEEELKQKIVDVLMDCAEEFPPTKDDIEMLKDKKVGDGENVKCLFACVYKKTGMMNEKGEMSVEGIQSLSQKYFAGNPEKMKQAMDYAEACKMVNDEKVSDGEKGCERAVLLFKCTVDKAGQFDFSD